MTTATRQVRFAPMRLDGSGAPTIAAGYYAIEPTSAYDDGTGRVEQLSLQVTVDGAAVTVDLPVTTTAWALKVTGTLYNLSGNRVTVEYVAVPAGAAITVIDFEDLVRVDPMTLSPTAVPEAAWWAAINRQAALIIQSGGSYPAPLPAGYAGYEFRGSVDPATQFTLVGDYLHRWVRTP